MKAISASLAGPNFGIRLILKAIYQVFTVASIPCPGAHVPAFVVQGVHRRRRAGRFRLQFACIYGHHEMSVVFAAWSHNRGLCVEVPVVVVFVSGLWQ